MKHFKILLLTLLFIPELMISQNLSGNVSNNSNRFNLDYANVEIYQNNNLVASLITDENGYYDVQLDSGTYVVNIMYSGFKTEVKEIVVNGNEINNVNLEEDDKSKDLKRERKVLEELEKKRKSAQAKIMVVDEIESISDMELDFDDSGFHYFKETDISDDVTFGSGSFVIETPKIKSESKGLYEDGYKPKKDEETKSQNAYAFGLTAGEINDFSKWEMWDDLTKGDLSYYQKTWKFSPSGRYSVLVMSEEDLPLANAKVELIDENSKVIWKSRTDNTGKAELWENIRFPIDSLSFIAQSIKVTYQNEEKIIKDLKVFSEGINTLKFKAECDPSNIIDIAFVVDATASMQDEIDYLKMDINKVIYEAKKIDKKAQLNFSSVFYRDLDDTYTTKYQDFTKVLSSSSAYIEDQFAEGGGDAPEALDNALSVAIDSLSWNENARTKVMFLVLDAPPHNNSKIQAKLRGLMERASQKGIRIVPITGSGLNKSTEYLMRSMSLATNGTYVFLTDHSGIGEGHIEPSTDSYDVEILNVLLQRILKSYIYIPSCDEEIPEIEIFTEMPDSAVVYEIPVDSTNQIITDSTITDITDPQDIIVPDEISWKYYPNPTYGPLNIEVSESVETLYLTDMTGKILREIRMNGNDFVQTDIGGLPMGVYFLRYPIGKKWLSGKVVLMR